MYNGGQPRFPPFYPQFLGKIGLCVYTVFFYNCIFRRRSTAFDKIPRIRIVDKFLQIRAVKKLSTILADVAEMDGDERTCVLEKGVGVTVELFGLALDEQVPYAEDIAV